MTRLEDLTQAMAIDVAAIRDQLGQGDQRSSVQIATSTRGYDIQVKCYVGSNVTEAGNAAVSEYLRVRQMIEAGLMSGVA